MPIEQLRRILSSLAVPMCLLDREIRYLAVSSGYGELCGADPDSLIGKPMVDYCPPDHVANAYADFQALDQGMGIALHLITRSERPYLVSVNPVYASGNHLPAAILVALTPVEDQHLADANLPQTGCGEMATQPAAPLPVSGQRDISEDAMLRSGHDRRRSQHQVTSQETYSGRKSLLGSRIPLSALLQTLAVAEHLNFSHAAAALGTSQSSISTRIRALELELGVLLFQRNTRGVRLTDAGRSFIALVQAGVRQLEHAVAGAKTAASGEDGRLRLAVYALICGSFLTELLARYRKEHPRIALEVLECSLEDAIAHLRGDRIDAAFVIGTPDLPDCHSRAIWNEQPVIVFATNHPLARRTGVTWQELASETFLVRSGGTGPQVEQLIVRGFARYDRTPTLAHFEVERSTLLSMVAEGFGISVVATSARSLPIAGLAFVPIIDETEPIVFSAVWSPHNRSPTLHNLLGCARQLNKTWQPRSSYSAPSDDPVI